MNINNFYRVILYYTLFFPGLLKAQSKNFVLRGEIKQLDKQTIIYLLKYSNTLNPPDKLIDSAYVINGKFHFNGKINHATKAQLVLQHSTAIFDSPVLFNEEDRLDFYLDIGTTIFNSPNDSIRNAKMTNSPTNDIFLSLNELLRTVDSEYSSEYELKASLTDSIKKSTLYLKFFNQKIEVIKQKKQQILSEFIMKNQNSQVSFDALKYLQNLIGSQSKVGHIDSLFKQLSDGIKISKEGKEFAKQIRKLKRLSVGNVAPRFSQMDTSGKKVYLSNFTGKYVLIEFWSVYCGPCRLENKNLVRVFNKYQNENFSIVSISLDKKIDRQVWLETIRNDGIDLWTQVSDMKGWNNKAAKLYAVNAIPQNFLIDPAGKIIAKNLKGTDLDEELSNIITKNGKK